MSSPSGIVTTVRNDIHANDFWSAEHLLRNYLDDKDSTPETPEALSWFARGSFAAHRFAKAADYARRVRPVVVQRLEDADVHSEASLASPLGRQSRSSRSGRPGEGPAPKQFDS